MIGYGILMLGLAIGSTYLAIAVGRAAYRGVRRQQDRPLTEEEKWQETSVESLSEEEWAALMTTVETGTNVDEPTA